jgi:hypothetical protein
VIEGTEYTDEPIYPYCGNRERDAWEINFGGMDGDTEHTCGSCGEDYFLSRKVLVSYSSSKLQPTRTTEGE